MLTEINVTPFVDVMLVLLIIFMITTPILYHGIKVNLPQTRSSEIPVKSQKRITITLTSSGSVFIEDSDFRLSEIGDAVTAIIKKEGIELGSERVFLKADKSVDYGLVVAVIDELKKAGIEKLNLVTEFEGTRRIETGT